MTDPSDPGTPPPTGMGRLLARVSQAGARPTPPPLAGSALVGRTSPGSPTGATPGSSSSSPGNDSALLMRLFAGADRPEVLLGAFAQGMSSLPGELGDMGARLHSAWSSNDWTSYGRAMRQLIDKYIRTIEIDTPDGGDSERLRDMLRHVLGAGVASLLQQQADLSQEPAAIAAQLRQWQRGQPLAPIEQRLRELCHQIGVRADNMQEQQQLLLSLFDLLLDNIGELLDDSSWLHGQVTAVRQLIGGPLDQESVEQTRSNLREVIYRQGLLKQGIVESKNAMKELMGDFVHRLDGMATSTGEYHDRISGYSLAVRNARSVADLNQLLQDVLQDTSRIQEQSLLARDHLANARAEVELAEQRIAELEGQLSEVSGLVRSDPLTGALNRRGLEELLESEVARATRSAAPLGVALLDMDTFSQTNTLHGHAGGDAALRHLVAVAQLLMRGSDSIARLGGDEFVLVLPDTAAADTMSTIQRLQRSLSHRPLLHDGVRVQVHFSAGTVQWQRGETAEDLLRRADQAMYEAKRGGRNRVQAG